MAVHQSTEANLSTIECESQALVEPSAALPRAFSLSESAGGAGAGAPYKDSIAKVITGQNELYKTSCGYYFSQLDCSTGLHHFGKKLFDGQEWCPVCGKMDSPAHRRRIARCVSKVLQLKRAAYLVVEWPLSFRPGLRTKIALRYQLEAILEVLAGHHDRLGLFGGWYSRGILRWHWFNDDRPGYPANVFNPHLNFLLDGWRLTKDELAFLKAQLKEATGCPDLIVRYSYTDKPGKIMHILRYITRATFTNRAWDNSFADELYNFRNMRSWGKWDDMPAWELAQAGAAGEDISGLEVAGKLHDHICPDCGAPLQSKGFKTKLNRKTGEQEVVCDRKTGEPLLRYGSPPLPSVFLELAEAVEIGAGYYRIPGDGFLPEPEHEHVNLAELRRINHDRLRALRKAATAKRRAANWSEYVLANWNRYVLSGDEGVRDG